MRPASDLISSELKWVRPDGSDRSYELRADGETAIRLYLGGALSTRATAEFNERTIEIEQMGFLGIRLRAKDRSSDEELAVYTPAAMASGGTLSFPSGGALLWRQSSFGLPNSEFRNAAGDGLIAFAPPDESNSEGHAVMADVEILDNDVENLPLLLVMGLVLIMGQADDDAAMTAALLAAIA